MSIVSFLSFIEVACPIMSRPRFASHRHRRGRSTASGPSPPHSRWRRRRFPESTLTQLVRPRRSRYATSAHRTRGIVPHRYRPVFSPRRRTPILARDPIHSIRNIVFLVQRIRTFPARGYLLAVSFAEVVGCGRGAARVGECD